MSIQTIRPVTVRPFDLDASAWPDGSIQTYRARHRESVPADSVHVAECECQAIMAAEDSGVDSPDGYRAPIATWSCPAHEPVRYSRDSARHYGTPDEGWVK